MVSLKSFKRGTRLKTKEIIMNKWIPASVTPKEHELVLLKDEDGDIVVGSYVERHDGPAWRIGNDSVIWDYDYNLDYYVTHWRKIPD